MPRWTRTKSERERFLIREFLRSMGYQVVRATYPDPPDAILTVVRESERLRLGIELTDYHLDSAPGQSSPAARLNSMFEAIQASIVRRISHRKDRDRLGELEGTFHLRTGLRKQHARPLAGEIVDFLSAVKLKRGERKVFSSFGPGHKLMCEYVSNLRLRRRGFAGYSNSHCNWRCFNTGTGNVGIVTDVIEAHIRQKAKKAAAYRRHNMDQLWLLITAAGDFVQRRAGPLTRDEERRMDSLRGVGQSSGFDRVLFWERVGDWCKEIWPGAPAVRFDQHGGVLN